MFGELHANPYFFRLAVETLVLYPDLDMAEAARRVRTRVAAGLGYADVWLSLDPLQRALTRALADGVEQPFGAPAREALVGDERDIAVPTVSQGADRHEDPRATARDRHVERSSRHRRPRFRGVGARAAARLRRVTRLPKRKVASGHGIDDREAEKRSGAEAKHDEDGVDHPIDARSRAGRPGEIEKIVLVRVRARTQPGVQPFAVR